VADSFKEGKISRGKLRDGETFHFKCAEGKRADLSSMKGRGSQDTFRGCSGGKKEEEGRSPTGNNRGGEERREWWELGLPRRVERIKEKRKTGKVVTVWRAKRKGQAQMRGGGGSD